jgi:hypothetical protein
MPGFYGFSASEIAVMPIRRCFRPCLRCTKMNFARKTGLNRMPLDAPSAHFVTAFRQFAQMVEAHSPWLNCRAKPHMQFA